ncbi:MAG: hypothetical protein LBC85_11845, partial [Fibromonadaceae bacterium]|nr:hypothetical protein [Fibromonadaceae bacterium]
SLQAIGGKASIVLLRILLDVIEKFGKPKVIRTDNESVFTSRLFRFALWLLGIRHQRIMLHCPWQNGRVESIWGVELLGRRGVELSLMSGHPRCAGSLVLGMGCCEGIGWVTGSFCFLGMGRIAPVRRDLGSLFAETAFLARFCC